MIRVWGEDLASSACYCFDFVNREHQYILTPNDVKIYTGNCVQPSVPVLSIEESLERAKATSLYSHATRHDPNWETHVIPEGTILRITQQSHPDFFFTYQCDTLLVRLWFSSPGERDVSALRNGLDKE